MFIFKEFAFPIQRILKYSQGGYGWSFLWTLSVCFFRSKKKTIIHCLFSKTFVLSWLLLLKTNPDYGLTSLCIHKTRESQIWKNKIIVKFKYEFTSFSKFSQWNRIVKNFFWELADLNEVISNAANGLLTWAKLRLSLYPAYGWIETRSWTIVNLNRPVRHV